ncbi:helix-turn-helix transcriptional regulator, partial [Vibrio cholerae]
GFRLRFAKSTLRRYNVDPENAVCVAITGDSMEPVLPNGSTVGIDCGDKTLIDGKIYAINHNGELFIKKLYRLPGGGLRIYSFNEIEYPPREYSQEQVAEQQISIVGRVFWYSVLL